MKRSQSVKGVPRDVRSLLNQQTNLNTRIQHANDQQSSLVHSLQVYQMGKKCLSEKEDQLLRLTTVVDQLCKPSFTQKPLKLKRLNETSNSQITD